MTTPPSDDDAIDWDALHRRLAAAQAAAERGLATTPEAKQALMRVRAQTLARPLTAETTEATLEVIEFLLAHERYALEARYVREVYPLRELTPVPGTPPFVLGLVNVRGQIVSVVDLKQFFNLPERGLTDLDKIIILAAGEMRFGILADVIFGARQLPAGDLQTELPTLTGIGEAFLKGVTRAGLIVLDAGQLLTNPALIIQAHVDG